MSAGLGCSPGQLDNQVVMGANIQGLVEVCVCITVGVVCIIPARVLGGFGHPRLFVQCLEDLGIPVAV